MNDLRGPGLPLLMAACIALLIGGALAVMWSKQPSPAEMRERLGPPPERPTTSAPNPFRSRSPRLTMPVRPQRDDRDDEVEELERELAQARAQLARLEEFRARYRERFPAQAEVDWSAALERIGQDARALLSDEAGAPLPSSADPADTPVAAPSGTADQPAGGDPDLDRRLRDMQSRLEIAEFLDEQQRLDNEQLRTDLAEAAAALTQEIQRARERAQQLEAEGILVDEASQALISLGQPAIPGLVQALASQDAHVREWAADVLGAMGTTGRPALPDLMEAVSDADANVRAAVRRAIDAIEHAEEP